MSTTNGSSAGIDCYVQIDRHYCSVPHQLIKQKLWVRITSRTVDVLRGLRRPTGATAPFELHNGQRVTSHAHTSRNRQHTTVREHIPANHRFRSGISPGGIRVQATRIGSNVETFVDVLMRNRQHPEQAYRACLGVLKLARSYGKDRLYVAGEWALEIKAHSYSYLNSIFKNGLDRVPRIRPSPSRQILQGKIACRVIDAPAITHPNIRVADYFN